MGVVLEEAGVLGVPVLANSVCKSGTPRYLAKHGNTTLSKACAIPTVPTTEESWFSLMCPHPLQLHHYAIASSTPLQSPGAKSIQLASTDYVALSTVKALNAACNNLLALTRMHKGDA